MLSFLCVMLLHVEGLPCVTAPIATGWASHYNPDIMESVVMVNYRHGNLPPHTAVFDTYVAVLDCDYVGSTILIRPAHTRQWTTALVSDCACACHPDTISWMQDNNIIVELDFPTALRWNAVGGGLKVDVVFNQP